MVAKNIAYNTKEKEDMKFHLLLALVLLAAACPDNCEDCDPVSGAICFVCSEGYEPNVMGQCVDQNVVPNCVLYGPTNQCFACKATYKIDNTDGSCKKEYSGCL